MGNSDSSSKFWNLASNREPEQSEKKGREVETSAPCSSQEAEAAVAGAPFLAIGSWSLSSFLESIVNKVHKIGVMNRAFHDRSQQEGGDHTICFSAPTPIRVMSYNVWFREDVQVNERMEAIGILIQKHSPDIILFQEVTELIYLTFQSSPWWKLYKCFSPPGSEPTRQHFCMLLSKFPVERFNNVQLDTSTMGRELCVAELKIEPNNNLTVASGHLKSPNHHELNITKRRAQAEKALKHLNNFPNVIFGGDMNWDEEHDEHFPLYGNWIDPWTHVRASENGWTYDTKENKSLRGNRMLQKRLDRIVCKLRDFKISDIEMIGMEAIPETTYCNKKKVNPVYPSDHFGLLLTIYTMTTSLCMGNKGRKPYLKSFK